MKHLLILTFCLLIYILPVRAQYSKNPTAPRNSEYYLKKSKSQKSTAWVLLIGGATMGFAGLAGSVNNGGYFYGSLMQLSFLSMGTSLPFFIGSAKNKGRASFATTKYELPATDIVNHGYKISSK